MAAETWTALTSLGGVAIGGGLSFLVQNSTQRTAARTEQRKLAAVRAEARRGERLALIERFVAVAAEAERCAFTRPTTRWEPDHPWAVATQAVMDRFWVAERMVRVIFRPPVHEAARAYFLFLNGAVWQGAGDPLTVRDAMDEPRLAFLDAARAALDQLD